MDRSNVFLTFCVILLYFQFCEGCSCGSKPMQQEYCDSDFVLLVVIDSVALTENGTEWEFDPNNWDGVKHRMRDIRVLRANAEYDMAVDKEHIHTASHGALCGAYLRNQTEYVIFGAVNKGYLHTTSCSRTKPWNWVSKKYQEDYRHKLPKYCSDCKIQQCTRYRPHPACNDKEYPDGNQDTCLMRDRQCALRAFCHKSPETGKCSWFHVMDESELSCSQTEPEITSPDEVLIPFPTIPEPIGPDAAEPDVTQITPKKTTEKVTEKEVEEESEEAETTEEETPEISQPEMETPEAETPEEDGGESEEIQPSVDPNLINPEV